MSFTVNLSGGGLLINRFNSSNMLKSTQEKLQRQQERDNKVAFFEAQKENLKNRKADSLEEISEKLEMFHNYEDEIAAANQEYNNSQMFHVMDEAEEHGEKIAEAAERNKPKTEEERKEENDSDLEDEYIKEIGNMKKLDEQFAKQQADIGWRVEQGWAIDKDGNISSWAIGHKDSKVKSFLQNMSEKAEEILQKQLEKAKDTKEVFSMKKHKEVIKKNKVDLKV